MNDLTPQQDVCISEEVLEIEMYLIHRGAWAPCLLYVAVLPSQTPLPRISHILMQLSPPTPIFIFGHICDVNSEKRTFFLGEREGGQINTRILGPKAELEERRKGVAMTEKNSISFCHFCPGPCLEMLGFLSKASGPSAVP